MLKSKRKNKNKYNKKSKQQNKTTKLQNKRLKQQKSKVSIKKITKFKRPNKKYNKPKLKTKKQTKKQIGGNNIKMDIDKERKIKQLQDMYKSYNQLHKTHNFSLEPQLEPFEIPIEQQIPQEQILVISKDILKDILKKNTYSLLPYFFKNHSPTMHDHDDLIDTYQKGNCVALAKHMQKRLKQKGLDSYICPATLPPRLIQDNYPKLGHVTAIIKTPTHFIIHEPAHFLQEPILVNVNGEKISVNVSVFGEDWHYKYDPTSNKIHVYLKDDNEHFYYDLRKIKNMEQSISYPINTLNRRIPIVAFDVDNREKLAHLSIRLDKGVLEGYNKNYNGNVFEKGWFPKFNWKKTFEQYPDFQNRYQQLSAWEGLNEQQCANLGYSNSEELREKVFAILHTHFN
jgi:hypothetical protein